jgi:hypothetical protein
MATKQLRCLDVTEPANYINALIFTIIYRSLSRDRFVVGCATLQVML